MGVLCNVRAAGSLIALGALCGCLGATGTLAQNAVRAEKSGAATVGALFVSDIHFDPFWDPAKAVRLKAAPVGAWNAILAAPEGADREARFDQLLETCHSRGADTSHTLYASSLRAIQEYGGRAKFVVLSGDLIAHGFDCKFYTLFSKAAPNEYRTFVEKTIAYVMREFHAALPGVPIYAALGNNDSDCADYRLDPNSAFLAASGKEFVPAIHTAERQSALRTFAEGGYYSVRLPAPLEQVRLLVLDDVFMSRQYETCGGKEDPAPAAAQIVWLKQQLDAARRAQEKVWVMAHIPPGVNVYATAAKGLDLCTGGKPQMFLSSDDLPDALSNYGDVIQLAIFGHTHMDEMQLLKPKAQGPPPGGVAVKVVPSISPINGNNPSFTLAEIDPATAELKDYRVFVASNTTGVDATWAEEYDFAKAYKEPAFDAATAADLITRLRADPTAQTDASKSYIHNYGSSRRELQLFWQPYTCAFTNDGVDAFRACVCGGQGVGSSR